MSIGSNNGRVGTSSVIWDKFDGTAAALATRVPDTVNQAGIAWTLGLTSAGLGVNGSGALVETTPRTYHDGEIDCSTPNRTCRSRVFFGAPNINVGVHVRGAGAGTFDYVYVSYVSASSVNIVYKNQGDATVGSSGNFDVDTSIPHTLVVEDDGTDYTMWLEDDDGNVVANSLFTETAAATATDTFYGIYADGATESAIWYDFQVI